ncbi:hypothetical protein FS837_007205 [Tulasnella sp. UAMH 9824]|nr:hypothetical protein FS837_007205 [Tulasnella sp. UAMH 9824]
MPTTIFDAPAPSSDTSDYGPDGTVDSDDSTSDQDEATLMSRPLVKEEVTDDPPLTKKASIGRIKDAWDHEPLAGQYDRATDVAPRLLVCGWQGCRSKLGSFALLEKATCRRVNTTRSALRRHLHTVHVNDPQFSVVLQNPVVTLQQAGEDSFPTSPILLLPVSPDTAPSLPSSSSKFPTYIAFLPRLRPAPLNHKRQKAVNDASELDPYFGEFFEEDEPLKPRHRLQLSRRPAPSAPNLERVKRLEKVQLTPSRRLRRTQSVVSATETSPEPDESHDFVFKVTHRVRGTTLCLPRREMPPPPDLSKVSWREFKAPVAPELETAVTDVGSSSRAPSVATLTAPSSRASSVELPVSEAFRKRKISPPPSSPYASSPFGLRSLPQAASVGTAVTKTESQATARSAAMVPTEPSLPPTIGFKALAAWRSGFEHAVEAGVMDKDEDPFLPQPVKTGRKKERAKKRGRPLKRTRLE